jgi:hypothetical protein
LTLFHRTEESIVLRLTTLAFLVLLVCSAVVAAPVFSTGAGSAVVSPDRIATFDSVATSTDLTSYSENGLRITTPKFAYVSYDSGFPGLGFSGGFHYPSGGVDAPTTITTTDGAVMYAAEFNAGDGWAGSDPLYFAWQTRLGGSTTGGGYYTASQSVALVFGIADAGGFDTLLLAAYDTESLAMGGVTAGGFQALAIDNLSVQVGPGGVVPEPSSLALVALGISIAGLLRRRR